MNKKYRLKVSVTLRAYAEGNTGLYKNIELPAGSEFLYDDRIPEQFIWDGITWFLFNTNNMNWLNERDIIEEIPYQEEMPEEKPEEKVDTLKQILQELREIKDIQWFKYKRNNRPNKDITGNKRFKTRPVNRTSEDIRNDRRQKKS